MSNKPWKFYKKRIPVLFRNATNTTDLEDRKTKSCDLGVERNIHTMRHVVSRVISDPSWQFYENLFIHFSVMLLTDTVCDEKYWEKISIQGVKRNNPPMFKFIPCVVSDHPDDFT